MLEDKLLYGYHYRPIPMENEVNNPEKIMKFVTGKGGAEMLIKAYREEGLDDETISNLVQVFVKGHWANLSQITIKEVEDDN